MKRINNKGFSLVELIVVIAIMAVLVGVLAPQFIRYVEKSKVSGDIQSLRAIKEATDTYYSDGDNTMADVTVTVADNKVTVSGDDVKSILSNVGLPTELQLKSKKWTGVSMKFVATTGKWTIEGKNTLDESEYDLSKKLQSN